MPPHPIVTLAPTLLDHAHKPKRSYSIAHDDLLSERIIIFHIVLEHGGKEAGIVQLSVVAYYPSKDEYCSKFDKCIQSPKHAKLEKGAMEVHHIQPN
jgi:hypothetical protein